MLDRSKFKATSMKELETQEKEVSNKVSGINSANFGEKMILHEIEEGDNYFRLYPKRPDHPGSLSIETKVINFLPYDAPMRDDSGKVIEGKFRRTIKPVFNAKVHGGAKIDLVEEYIKFAEKLAAENFTNDEDKVSFLAPIQGNIFNGGKFRGIAPIQSWLVYADKYVDGKPVFGRLEFKKAVKMGINSVAQIESANQPLGTTDSCFTDVDRGRLVLIKYNRDASPRDKYKVLIDPSVDPETDKIKRYPLTDDQIENFLNVEPLINYRSYFKRRDFELQFNGLKLFDEEHNYGIFEYDEFLDIVEKISDLYEEEDQQEEQKEEVKKEEKKVLKTKVLAKKEVVEKEDDNDSSENDEEETSKSSSSTEDRIARIRSLRDRVRKQ